MPIQVFPISEDDIPSAVDCIQKAFAEDPYSRWVFNDHAKFSLKRNSVAKDTDDPNGEVLGVACWLAPRNPSAPQTWRDYWGDWWLWLNQVRMNLWYGRGGLNVKRYYIWKSAQAEAQKQLWDDEKGYYFCNIVTVLPTAQGKGIGRTLVKTVTHQADQEGRKCYLESSRADPNIAIYERMGFKLAKEMICDDEGDAIKLYCMMREPQVPL